MFRAAFLLPLPSLGCAGETIAGHADPGATCRLTDLAGPILILSSGDGPVMVFEAG